MPRLMVAFFVSLSAGCASFENGEVTEPLAYNCDDLVIVGRLFDQHYASETIPIEGDLLGHGWFTANVNVKKVFRGATARPVLSVKYFAHTFMRDDREFLFVLQQTDGQGYTVAAARLLGRKNPSLSRSCS